MRGDTQAMAHAPQLPLSVIRLTHAVPQSVVPVGHVVVHTPLTHVAPVAHALPQAPQLAGSLVVSTHALPHIV
jgi:hypothetical protein